MNTRGPLDLAGASPAREPLPHYSTVQLCKSYLLLHLLDLLLIVVQLLSEVRGVFVFPLKLKAEALYCLRVLLGFLFQSDSVR